MAIENLKQLVDAELEGRARTYAWRKTPSQANAAGYWFDLAMSPGYPPPKYWFDAPPLIAKSISHSQDNGIYHGGSVSPFKKYLRTILARASAVTALPMTMLLCDYLLYYPSIDESTTDVQLLTNSASLPRYTDGAGVQIAAISLAGRAAKVTFSASYTNQDGVAGRTTGTAALFNSAVIGNIVTSNMADPDSANPFLRLQGSDTGVRSIESVTMNGPDVGLFALVLMKPLALLCLKEVSAPYEKDFYLVSQEIEAIQDDAYLNFLCLPNGALNATTLLGSLKVIFG